VSAAAVFPPFARILPCPPTLRADGVGEIRAAGPGQNLRLMSAHHARTPATRADILLALVHPLLSIPLFHAAS
jgi:hypothetical protein